MSKIEIKTNDGVVDCYTFKPEGSGKYPGIILLMDGVGIRPSLHELSKRFADEGYFVLMPNLFYRAGEYAPFDPYTCFNPGPEKERLFSLIKSVSNPGIIEDMKYFIQYLKDNPEVSGEKFGCVGYCLGGRAAMLAAINYPDDFAAAAAFHAGSIVTDNPDSPHLMVDRIKAKVYVGVAELDHSFTAEHTKRLREAVDGAGANFEIEVYPNAAHGFAMVDTAAYDKASEERHMAKALELFNSTLK